MKLTPLLAAALVVCLALPGPTDARGKKPKPAKKKTCKGKDGVRYEIGDGYVDTESCIEYTCTKKGKGAKMVQKKGPCGTTPATQPPTSGCVKEDNTNYWGNDIANMKKSSWEDCANWCRLTPTCKFWTIRKSDNWCWIKTSKSGYKIQNGILSGSKNCGTGTAVTTTAIPSTTTSPSTTEKCPWSTPTSKGGMMQCGDGTFCNVKKGSKWSCCKKHDGRRKCPPSYYMCAAKTCVGNTQHCCEPTCDRHGGPRPCEDLGAMERKIEALEESVQTILEKVMAIQSTSDKHELNITSNMDSIRNNKESIVSNQEDISSHEQSISQNTNSISTNSDTCSDVKITAHNLGTCLSDINSMDCPSSEKGKTSITDAIADNRENIEAQGSCCGGSGETTTPTIPPQLTGLFSDPVKACLKDFNNEMIKTGLTLEECKQRCYSATSFVCKSFDYVPLGSESQSCYLSEETKDTQPSAYTEPCYDGSDCFYLEQIFNGSAAATTATTPQTTTSPLPTGCIVEDGVFISAGNNAPNGQNLVTSGPFECASKCYSNPDCIAWTLKLSDNECWLKTVYEGYTAKNDSWTTGTKACGETQGSNVKFLLKGKTGQEHVTISIGGNETEYVLTTNWQTFSYPRPSSGSFSVEFHNDNGPRDVYIQGHESQVTDLLPETDLTNLLCGTSNENERCDWLRKGNLLWNGKYTYTLKGYRVSGTPTNQVTAEIGATLWTDRSISDDHYYIITKMPQELIGSTLFQPKAYVDKSTIEIFSPHKATIYVALYEPRDGGLMEILPKQGWTLKEGWFVEWNLGSGERLHKIWSKQVDAGNTTSFTTSKDDMTFVIFISKGEWTAGVWLNDDATSVVTNIESDSFNSLFRACPVVQYTRNGAVYAVYVRTSPVTKDFNAFSVFTDTWASKDNLLNTDFKLYNTLEDAKEDKDAWQVCNYDDNDIGFPRDCGQNAWAGGRWFSMPGGRVNAPGIMSGVGFDIYSGSTCPALECRNGGELLSTSPSKKMVLCNDVKNNTCEKNLEELCPAGWHLCSPKEFNNRNEDWTYPTPELTMGEMFCRLDGGTSPFEITQSLNKDDPGNCSHLWSSRPGCTLWENNGDCNNKEATALCCSPAATCGNGEVDTVEEECDDGNDDELDECLNSCTWRTPRNHGLDYC